MIGVELEGIEVVVEGIEFDGGSWMERRKLQELSSEREGTHGLVAVAEIYPPSALADV